MPTTVIHHRDRGSLPQDRVVYIGRPSFWGNPHPVGRTCPRCRVTHTRAEAIAAFEASLTAEQRRLLPTLKGKVLVCWCAPRSCHGDVLARLADAL